MAFDPDKFLEETPKSAGFDPDAFLGEIPERGVLERAGEAVGETTKEGWEAAKRLAVPPDAKEARDYLGPSGMWRSFKETGAGILSPLTATLGAATAGLESLGASGLGAAQRGLERGISAATEQVNPELAARMRANIPTSEQAYETAKPYAGAALSAIGAGPKAGIATVPSLVPPLPRTVEGVTLSEGQFTGKLPAIQREQSALRGTAGEPVYERAQAFRAQQEHQIEARKTQIASDLDQLGNQVIAETPQEAGQIVSTGVQRTRSAAKAEVDRAYAEARARPGEIHAGAFEGMPQRIKGDLTLADDPVVIDNRTTPSASGMIDYLDQKIGELKIQNKADPFGPPSSERIAGISLNGVDRWRRNLSVIRRGAATPEDGRAAQAVMDAFDARINEAVTGGQFTGDADAIAAWNFARAAHADYAGTFRKARGMSDPVGNVVEKILGKGMQDPATPNDVMSFISGSSGVSPNSLNVGVTKRIKGILGEDSQEWTAVKQGVFRKLVEKPEDMKDFGHGVIANRLGEFLNGKGKSLAEQLYSPTERAALGAYLKLMRKLEVPQAGANWSNNYPLLNATKHIIRGIGTAIGAGIGHFVGGPYLGEIAGAGVGYAAATGVEAIQQRARLRQIAKQMPLVADQIAKWQRAVAKAHALPAAGKAELALATRELSNQLAGLYQYMPKVSFAPDWREKHYSSVQDSQGFRKGGRVTKSFRYPA